MSRTDKTRPYEIQRNDDTLPGYEVHNHANGDCEFETLEQWKHRYNDKLHQVRGGKWLNYPCSRELRRDVRNSCFGDDPDRKDARERFKRHDRQTARKKCHQARQLARKKGRAYGLNNNFGDNLTDQLTQPYPRKRYYPEDQAYSGGTSKVSRAIGRKYRLRKEREQAEAKDLTRREAALQRRDEHLAEVNVRHPGFWAIYWLYRDNSYQSQHGSKSKTL